MVCINIPNNAKKKKEIREIELAKNLEEHLESSSIGYFVRRGILKENEIRAAIRVNLKTSEENPYQDINPQIEQYYGIVLRQVQISEEEEQKLLGYRHD